MVCVVVLAAVVMCGPGGQRCNDVSYDCSLDLQTRILLPIDKVLSDLRLALPLSHVTLGGLRSFDKIN